MPLSYVPVENKRKNSTGEIITNTRRKGARHQRARQWNYLPLRARRSSLSQSTNSFMSNLSLRSLVYRDRMPSNMMTLAGCSVRVSSSLLIPDMAIEDHWSELYSIVIICDLTTREKSVCVRKVAVLATYTHIPPTSAQVHVHKHKGMSSHINKRHASQRMHIHITLAHSYKHALSAF
mgnify:CR=1 FL=1